MCSCRLNNRLLLIRWVAAAQLFVSCLLSCSSAEKWEKKAVHPAKQTADKVNINVSNTNWECQQQNVKNQLCKSVESMQGSCHRYQLKKQRYLIISWSYTVKKVSDFSVPTRDVTNQTLPGEEEFNNSRPGRVSDILAGDREIAKLFLQCIVRMVMVPHIKVTAS